MPFKSDAQRKKLNAMAAEGKISQKTVDEMNKASKGLDLPDRVPAPKKLKGLDLMKDKIKKRIKEL